MRKYFLGWMGEAGGYLSRACAAWPYMKVVVVDDGIGKSPLRASHHYALCGFAIGMDVVRER